MKRWIFTLVASLGVGAGLSNLGNLEGWPLAGQIVLMVAVVLLALIKLAPDLNRNTIPDALEGTWGAAAVRWLVPVLTALAAAAGITTVSGCGLELQVRPPAYQITESGGDNPLPDRTEFALTVATNKGVDVRFTFVQVGSDPYPATGCVEAITHDGVVIDRLCGSCEWAAGVSACRLVPSTPLLVGDGL